MIEKPPGCEFEAFCDGCNESIVLERNFQESIETLRSNGWSSVKNNEGQWENYCPACSEQQGENKMAKSELLHTPIGKVKFTKTVINETEYRSLYVPPGYDANDKSNKSIWSFTLTLDPKDEKVKQLMALLDEEHKKIKGANFVPYKADKSKDQETGELKDTGLIAVNFRSGYPPVMFDSLKKKLSGIYVGWGSKVKVAFTVKPVNKKGKVGLGRYVKALQILEISQGSGDYGFEEEGDYATAGVGTGEGEQTEAWEE